MLSWKIVVKLTKIYIEGKHIASKSYTNAFVSVLYLNCRQL